VPFFLFLTLMALRICSAGPEQACLPESQIKQLLFRFLSEAYPHLKSPEQLINCIFSTNVAFGQFYLISFGFQRLSANAFLVDRRSK